MFFLKRILFKYKLTIVLLVLLLPVYFLLYKLYIPHILSFGCFDDCFNYVGGHFILDGKLIFTDFFFNHSPFGAFISAFVQLATDPINTFDLVLRHRQFILLFSLAFNVLLILRFRVPAFLFVIFFEFSKFYLFGDRFLAESMVVYPCIYMGLLVLSKLNRQNIFFYDYMLSSFFVWFIIFSREPYAFFALFTYVFLICGKPFFLGKKVSLIFVFTLGILTVLSFKISDFYFNLVTININTVLIDDLSKNDLWGHKILQIFFYPFYVVFQGEWNIFRQIEVFIAIVFLVQIFFLLKQKKFLVVSGAILMLGLVNLRIVVPGNVFYEAFHILIWWGLLISITFNFIFLNKQNKKLFIASLAILVVGGIAFVGSNQYFGKEKVDQQADLLTHYGDNMQEAEVLKVLSDNSDTLFLDGSDDLIYWQSDLNLSYKYAWYTSVMRHFEKYTKARDKMFRTNPPDFYREYGSCPKEAEYASGGYSLPEYIRKDYVRLLENGQRSCIFVHRKKITEISEVKFEKIKDHLFSLPNETD